MKASGDHQVKDEEQVVRQLEHDAFADAAKARDALTFGRRQRRLKATHQKRALEARALEHLPHHERAQALDVDRHVGQLGHRQRRLTKVLGPRTRTYPPAKKWRGFTACPESV